MKKKLESRNMTIIGRMGGLTTSSRHDPQVYSAPGRARANGLEKWLERVPEDLPDEERMRRAEALRRLHFVELRHKSAKARRATGKSKD